LVTWYCSADEINLYSINTGSYVYHLTHNHGQYTENFENNFISVERKFSDDSKYSFVLGTMKNSFDDRCGCRRKKGLGRGGIMAGFSREYMAMSVSFSLMLSVIAAIMAHTMILRKRQESVFSLYLSWVPV
jgi:hypothetical protein